MRKVVLYIACSLDGFIAGKNGDLSWLFHDADYGYQKFYSSIGTVLCGRKTYETARKFEKIPFKGKNVLVFSRKALPLPKNASLAKNPPAAVKALLSKKGNNVWLCGGSQIFSTLLNAGLCHEIRVSIHPVILGGGILLFRGIKARHNLVLVSSTPYKSGLVSLHYRMTG